MKPITLHSEWSQLRNFHDALIEVRGTIPEADFAARVAECERVDQPGTPRTRESRWHSEPVRDNYLASIMRGTILIGS